MKFALLGESSFSYNVNTATANGSYTFEDGKLVYGINKMTVPVSGGSVTVEGAAPTAVTATRTIAPGSVPSGGGEVTVTVKITGIYSIGSVEETLPPGFSYVDESVTPSDISATKDGRKVKFALLGESSFSYNVNTATGNGSYTFEDGKLVYGINKMTVPVSGGSVTVEGAAPTAVTATRTIAPGSVPSGGGEVTVTVKITGIYSIGSVEETLPPGFSYVDESVTPSDISATRDGEKVKFALVGESSFSYKVNARGTTGGHSFEDGKLIYGIDKMTVPVSGGSVTVEGAAPTAVTATRTMTPGFVPSGGGEVTVTVDIAGMYGIGSVEETLPPGFSYVDESVTPSEITATRDGEKVKFALVGESSFSYKVNARGTTGKHSFVNGKLVYGIEKMTVPVSGGSVTVEGAAPTAVTATRTITPGSVPSGGGEVTVTVNIAGIYGIGSVEETLPPGFSYVDESVTPSDISATKDGRKGEVRPPGREFLLLQREYGDRQRQLHVQGDLDLLR